MNHSKQSIFTRIKTVTVLSVVVFSLIVHLFINSISGNSVVVSNLQICKTALSIKSDHKVASIQLTTKHSNKHKFFTHINKRFQPESYVLPVNDFYISELSESYIDQHKIGHPTTYLLFSVIIARTLRGPPALA